MSNGKIIGVVSSVIVAVLALSLGVWAFKVVTAPVKGRGDAIIQKNTATNWVQAQELFEQRYADVQVAGQRIQVASTALKQDPKNPTLRTNYTGVLNYCLQIVADYNADARKYSLEDFRSADLPDQLDSTTYCPQEATS